MKYNLFKIFKFSTISRKIDQIRYIYSRIYKIIKNIPTNTADLIKITLKNIFLKTNKFIRFLQRNFLKIFETLDIRRIYKYFDIRRYNFFKLSKNIGIKNYKNLTVYFITLLIISTFTYIFIPTFYNYDKLKIEKIICNNNIECSIKGKVGYSFYPSPRIKIKNLIINDRLEKKNKLAKINDTEITISIINLLFKEKQRFKNISLKNFEININLKNMKKYKNIFSGKTNFLPTSLSSGQITLFDGKDYVATISNVKLNSNLSQNLKEAVLKGKFLNNKIRINLKREKIDNKFATDIVLKMSDLNLSTKVNFLNLDKKEEGIEGNISIKKNKNKFTGIFNYKNNEMTIQKSNLRNPFMEGKLMGNITFLPYFNFNLDLDLNSINFTKLYNSFLSLDENKQKSLFKINQKINGKLNFSTNKIYSSYNLVKSFESRLKFNNGNITIEQFLFNLGKLGAADILGTINNEKEFTNFKYEGNVFMDNQKKFLSKFGVYKKKNIPSNLYISGNFDLQNIKTSFYEISGKEKFANEDIDFIEQEFNDIMLEDNYTKLFRFPKFKEFIKSVTSEEN